MFRFIFIFLFCTFPLSSLFMMIQTIMTFIKNLRHMEYMHTGESKWSFLGCRSLNRPPAKSLSPSSSSIGGLSGGYGDLCVNFSGFAPSPLGSGGLNDFCDRLTAPRPPLNHTYPRAFDARASFLNDARIPAQDSRAINAYFTRI